MQLTNVHTNPFALLMTPDAGSLRSRSQTACALWRGESASRSTTARRSRRRRQPTRPIVLLRGAGDESVLSVR